MPKPLDDRLNVERTLRALQKMKVERPFGDRFQLEMPVERHERVDEQLARARAVCSMVIAKVSLERR